MGFEELIHYLRLGGITMGVILAASIISLVVAIERAIALWGLSEQSRALGETIARHLLRGDVAAGRSAAERADVPTADIYLAGFDRLDRSRAAGGSLEAAVERERAQVGLRLRKHLWILGTIGATTPFVGLFGTVAGIMRSFRDLGIDVGSGGTGNTAVVMTGISEALITTAGGILVAVEAVVLYNYFQSRLARISIELRLLADEFIELLRERPIGSGTTAAPPVEAANALPAAVESPVEG
jgi:biopolymer transport protein ExbB/TolQ